MSKHKVDMGDYDDSRSGDVYAGPEPKRGVYDGKLTAVEDHTSASGNEGIKWTFIITKGEYKGWRGYLYTNLDTALWKTQQIVHAITGSKKSITIDTDEAGAKIANKSKPVRMRVVTEKYEDEMRGKLRQVLMAADEADDDEDGEDEDPFA